MIETLTTFFVVFCIGAVVGKLWDWFVAPHMPSWWHRFWSWLLHGYMDLWRPFIPDSVYKLWLKTGIMEESDYRAFQEKGHIKDDVDPQHIQKYE